MKMYSMGMTFPLNTFLQIGVDMIEYKTWT